MESSVPSSKVSDILSMIFAIIALAIGLVNTFWGNDPFYGLFIVLLSFLFIPYVSNLVQGTTGFRIRGYMKVLLGLFILWSALGVGELFDKVRLMMGSFRAG
jgi:hypothetical protein